MRGQLLNIILNLTNNAGIFGTGMESSSFIDFHFFSTGRPTDLDFRATPSFLFNTSNLKYSSQSRLSPTSSSPSNSINAAYKRQQSKLSAKRSNSNSSPTLNSNSRTKHHVSQSIPTSFSYAIPQPHFDNNYYSNDNIYQT